MKSYRTQIVTLLLLFCGYAVQAQHYYNNQVSVQNVTCKQKGNTVNLSMNIDASHADVPRRHSLILTPVVKSGDREAAFPPVVISGKNRYKADKRMKAYDGSVFYEPAYAVVRSGVDASPSIGYDHSIAYEPWMKTAHVEMREQVYGCSTCKKSEASSSLANLEPELIEPQKPDGKPLVSYVTPTAEAVKNRNMEGKAYLDFPAGKAVILTDFRNNFKELSKIEEAINQLRGDDNTQFNAVVLKGYASPEGSYKTNAKLSEQRSQALKNYLQKEYTYPDKMFQVSSVAEDWDGLKQLVEASSLADKQAVLDIINDGSQDFDAKERKLKTLKGGTVYKELLADYFPKLRRVDYKLDYTIRAFSVEEGKDVIKKQPGQMSLNEMFLVANTYPKGSADFNQVFDVAVRMYPNDKVANINAAAISLEKGDIATARRQLDRYRDAPESWNNLGVMYLLDGDYTKASEFLTKAKGQGSPEAAQNLELLAKLQDYQAKMKAYEAAKNSN